MFHCTAAWQTIPSTSWTHTEHNQYCYVLLHCLCYITSLNTNLHLGFPPVLARHRGGRVGCSAIIQLKHWMRWSVLVVVHIYTHTHIHTHTHTHIHIHRYRSSNGHLLCNVNTDVNGENTLGQHLALVNDEVKFNALVFAHFTPTCSATFPRLMTDRMQMTGGQAGRRTDGHRERRKKKLVTGMSMQHKHTNTNRDSRRKTRRFLTNAMQGKARQGKARQNKIR